MKQVINVYFLNVDFLNDKTIFTREYENVLPYRKKKIDILQNQGDKILSLGAEILLEKACLNNDISYHDVEINFNEYGKAYIKGKPFLYNISHSGNMVMLVESKSIELGCDIELIHNYNPELIKRFYSEDEVNKVANADNQKEEFFKIWTMKESYIKCLGKGLNIALNSFSSLKDLKPAKIVYSEIKDNYCISICALTESEVEIVIK